MLNIFSTESYAQIDRLRVAVLNLESTKGLAALDKSESGVLQDSVLAIQFSQSNIDCAELLRRTDNPDLNVLTICWNSTGLANRLGYCQHATPVWDRRHLRHGTGHEFTLYK